MKPKGRPRAKSTTSRHDSGETKKKKKKIDKSSGEEDPKPCPKQIEQKREDPMEDPITLVVPKVEQPDSSEEQKSEKDPVSAVEIEGATDDNKHTLLFLIKLSDGTSKLFTREQTHVMCPLLLCEFYQKNLLFVMEDDQSEMIRFCTD